nr:hypothetical protein [Nonomuraea diastatica]
MADIEEVAAFHGDAHELLVYRFFKKDRPALFELAGKLRLKATSSDDSVLAALAHAREYSPKRRDFIPLPPAVEEDEPESGIAFASGNWRRAVTDRRRGRGRRGCCEWCRRSRGRYRSGPRARRGPEVARSE